MSLFSKILFFIIPPIMLMALALSIIVRSILIKLGERESYFMASLIEDLILLKRINKKEGGKYCFAGILFFITADSSRIFNDYIYLKIIKSISVYKTFPNFTSSKTVA